MPVKTILCTYTENNNDRKYSYRETSNIMFEYTIDNLNGRISGPGQMVEADKNIHIIRPPSLCIHRIRYSLTYIR